MQRLFIIFFTFNRSAFKLTRNTAAYSIQLKFYLKLLKNIFFRFDFEKFLSACSDVKQNVQGRLNQWVEYEHQHDKLVVWINDCEANLKTYNLRASLEEKTQQLDRFQVHFFHEK